MDPLSFSRIIDIIIQLGIIWNVHEFKKNGSKTTGNSCVQCFLLTDILEERVFTMKRVLLSSANVDVSIRIGAVLGRPACAPIPTLDFGDIVAKKHHVRLAQFGVFLACRVVMFDGMKMRWGDALVFMPRTNIVGPVFRGGSDDSGGGR